MDISAAGFAASPQGRPSCCLLVPIHQLALTEAEALSLVLSHSRATHAADLYLLHPPSRRPLAERICAWFAHERPGAAAVLRLEQPERSFTSLESYSSLLLSADFYQRLHAYEWLLIVQPDALLLTEAWSNWLAMPYSYIGAPMFAGLEEPVEPLRLIGGGNGGLSLRNLCHCRAVLEYRGWLYPQLRCYERATLPHQPWRAEFRSLRHHLFTGVGCIEQLPLFEDLFWSYVAPQLSALFTVAPPELAMRFAFEAKPQWLWERTGQLPAGCHAYARYGAGFWAERFSECPELIGPYREPARRLAAATQALASPAFPLN